MMNGVGREFVAFPVARCWKWEVVDGWFGGVAIVRSAMQDRNKRRRAQQVMGSF